VTVCMQWPTSVLLAACFKHIYDVVMSGVGSTLPET